MLCKIYLKSIRNHRNLNSSVINFLDIELNSRILAHLGGTQRGLLLALDKTGFLHLTLMWSLVCTSKSAVNYSVGHTDLFIINVLTLGGINV